MQVYCVSTPSNSSETRSNLHELKRYGRSMFGPGFCLLRRVDGDCDSPAPAQRMVAGGAAK